MAGTDWESEDYLEDKSVHERETQRQVGALLWVVVARVCGCSWVGEVGWQWISHVGC